MHVFGAFELEIRPGTPDNPAGIKIALLRYTRGEGGRLSPVNNPNPNLRQASYFI
jgi:hypothetical protein